MEELLNNAPCGFLTFSDDGEIRSVNETLLAILGFERAEVEGQHIQSLLTAGGRVFYQTHVFPLRKMHRPVEEIYIKLRSKGGEEIPVLINARRSERAGVIVNDCVFMRMRQRGNFEEELLKAKKAAQKANKAKDEFLAALSHELRTPLSPVLMLSTVMELDAALPPEVREQAGIIRRNTELEARLIDDLLDLTRIAHGKLKLVPAPVDIHTLLCQSEEIVLSESRGKRVSVYFQKEAKEHHVQGDQARLQQVLWNVIKNAIKFTPSGKDVRVITENPCEGRIRVRVVDSGIGIDPEALPRIFNAFEQGGISTQRFGGLGLGLAITRAIVEMHGGSIRAESQGKGCGATFSVELNTIPAPKPAAEIASPVTAAPFRRLHLLLVEDHESTREVLTRILRRSGYKVDAAGSGGEALTLAASAAPFDAVVSDLGLPDQSGFDLMRTLKAKYNLPGIALSGYGMEEDLRKAKAAGFCAHLVKPVPYDQLCVLLEQIATGVLV
ncbi:MAG: PAS domain-containing hybrid sensor histidine kinase/response regulator [Verrucomicrobiaceae bacterium]|nr:MAG: PAS domain-containing hybrid sensor histidine kinase/response regulator [Verrucomicrobiaceae bacterium]